MSPLAAAGQLLTTLEFSFSNPGARSLGFGSAFVALADDATAAFANPAGLVLLTRPEVSLEGRSWSYTTPYTRGGRAAGDPTGIGIDTVPVPLTGESSANLTGLSFASFVYPGKRWSIALFQHQLMNFEMTQEIQGLFTPGSVAAGSERGPIERGLWDLEIVTRGLSVAYQVTEKLSLGLGVSYFNPSGVSVGSEYLPDDDTFEGYFAEASFLAARQTHQVISEAKSSDWGLAAGFLWDLADNWSLGGVYRQGPKLEWQAEFVAGPVNPDFPPGTTAGFTIPLDLPDVYGLGVSYRSDDGRWTGAFEWDRVEYSSIIETLDPAFKDPEDTLDDADELHLGAEYAFLGAKPVFAVRLGLWLDPDHQVRNESDRPFSRAELPPGADELHYAAGFGVAFKRFQLDLGIDLSERVDTASISAIYSF
jgi:long-subunit fatty acid transport protein